MGENPVVPILMPDAGPLITLAYAERLDLLLRPGWPVHVVDMVLHEVTRHQTPTSRTISAFVAAQGLTVISTDVWRRHEGHLSAAAAGDVPMPRKAGLGELAAQEYMNRLAQEDPVRPAVFLFEDHKIARASFHLPKRSLRISTRAFLLFLEQKGWIASTVEVERRAIQAGRRFSQLRFP